MDNRVDARSAGSVTSAIRTGAGRVTQSARGPGRLDHEPDGRRKTDPRPRCETMPTPGVAPREDTARERSGGVPWTERVSRSRRASKALPELPPEYGLVLDAGLAALGLDLPPAARTAIDDHVRLLLAWTAAINLTAIREPAAVARAHVLDSLTGGRARCATAASPGSSISAPAVATRACRWPRPSPPSASSSSSRSAKKARFLETVVEATAVGAVVEVVAARAEALAADPAHRGRWPAVTARAVASLADLVELELPAPRARRRARRLEARRPRRARSRPPSGPSRRFGGGSMTSVPVDVSGLEDHRLVVITSSRPRAGRAIPAIPRRASDGRGERAAARLTADADRRPLGHPQQHRRARRGPRPPRLGRCRLAPRRRRRLRPGARRRRRTPRVARRGRRPGQPRRGGGRRSRDRLLQPGGAGGDGVDASAGSRAATRDWLAALPERHVERRRDAGPRQPARSHLGVRHVVERRPGEHRGHDDEPRPARPHARPGRVRDDRRPPGGHRAVRRRPASTSEDRVALVNPGSVGQPRDGDPAGELPRPRSGRPVGRLAPGRIRHRGRDGGHARGRPAATGSPSACGMASEPGAGR